MGKLGRTKASFFLLLNYTESSFNNGLSTMLKTEQGKALTVEDFILKDSEYRTALI